MMLTLKGHHSKPDLGRTQWVDGMFIPFGKDLAVLIKNGSIFLDFMQFRGLLGS